MFEMKKNFLMTSDIASYLGLVHIGDEIEINHFGDHRTLENNGFSYIDNENEFLNNISKCLILCPINYVANNANITYIRCANPKLSFYNVVNEFFIEYDSYKISMYAFISKNATLGLNINIGSNSFIGENVMIGDNTYIGNNVTIKGFVSIGRNCYIKDGAVIGSEGFDFIKENNTLIHIPQVGKIEIENNVWIGTNSVVERATLDKTIIKNNAKIDDLVQVGNSCIVGSGTQIAAGVILGAYSKIGSDTFVGMNASVKEKIILGNKVVVGSGASVISDLENGKTYIGVPAKILLKRKR